MALLYGRAGGSTGDTGGLRPGQGRAGTAVIFTHDLIHTSLHETHTYRRVVHLTFGTGSELGGSERCATGDILASDFHFRKNSSRSEHDRKPGIKWLSCTAK
jgi:hypothetical protein